MLCDIVNILFVFDPPATRQKHRREFARWASRVPLPFERDGSNRRLGYDCLAADDTSVAWAGMLPAIPSDSVL